MFGDVLPTEEEEMVGFHVIHWQLLLECLALIICDHEILHESVFIPFIVWIYFLWYPQDTVQIGKRILVIVFTNRLRKGGVTKDGRIWAN